LTIRIQLGAKDVAASHILAYIVIPAVVIMSPALLGATLRVFLPDQGRISLSILAGVIMALVADASASGVHHYLQIRGLPEQMANMLVTGVIVVRVGLHSGIASLGIRFVDRRRMGAPP